MKMPAPLPENEVQRLAALRQYEILDTLDETSYDDITRLAAYICDTPIAVISLVDEDRQWFKSHHGLAASETPRDVAFCAHAILQPGEVMEVPNATGDMRFAENPLVTGDLGIRFYAGAPLVIPTGEAIGTICVIDHKPRELTPAQIEALRALSRQVVAQLELRRLLAERELNRQSQQTKIDYLSAIGAAAQDLKVFLDRDYVCHYANETYLRYWRKERGEVVAKPISELLGEAIFAERVKPLLDRALAGEPVEVEESFIFPGKGERQVSVAYSPAFDTERKIIGVVVRIHDIHHLKQVEETLQASIAMLEKNSLVQRQFIYILSHDLREPVNTMVNFSSVLLADYAQKLDEAARKYLRFIAAGGQRMKQLLDDLLSYTQLEKAQGEAVSEVDLGQLLREVMADLGDAISRQQATLVFQDLPTVRGQRSMLRLLLQNLIANAIKFHPPGMAPRVSTSVVEHDAYWELMVGDNGIGIDAAQLDAIFNIFTRLHTRKEYEGTGMGLAICRKIAEAHGGRIWVESVQGQGSIFHVTLRR